MDALLGEFGGDEPFLIEILLGHHMLVILERGGRRRGGIVGQFGILEEDDEQIERRKSALVRQIVRDLPEPCSSLLWGFYRDGFSMKTLASMLNYASESSVKVTKHRCCDKFKKRYSQLVEKLF